MLWHVARAISSYAVGEKQLHSTKPLPADADRFVSVLLVILKYDVVGNVAAWLIPLSQVVMFYRHHQVWHRPDACRWRSFVGGDSAALVALSCGGSVGR